MSVVVCQRRALAALRPIDGPSGLPITKPLQVTSPGLRFLAKPGLYVVIDADNPALHAQILAFTTAPSVPPRPFVVTVRDPAGRWLPRLATLRLPRDGNPVHKDQADSLFRPLDLLMFPAVTASATAWAALVQVSVLRGGSGLRGALVRVRRKSDGRELGRGLSDERGETLVVIPDLPAHSFAGEHGDDGDASPDAPVLTADTAAILDVLALPPARSTWPLDPDQLEARRGTSGTLAATTTLTLRAGRRLALSLTVTAVD